MVRPLYIILRNDLLGMSPGRAAAMASHGTSIFHEMMRRTMTLTNPFFSFMNNAFREWRKEAGDFGTTIVLKASWEEIQDFYSNLENNRKENLDVWNTCHSLIIDPEYHVSGPGETFCAKNVPAGLVVFAPEQEAGKIEVDLIPKIKALKLY